MEREGSYLVVVEVLDPRRSGAGIGPVLIDESGEVAEGVSP
ncbi:hypothetical protein F750_3792 [Streptomyces sp. PAMC 26508]|nr:hypothetical protein F750_3792 [Streptomyces sp. PAMC 26508]